MYELYADQRQIKQKDNDSIQRNQWCTQRCTWIKGRLLKEKTEGL